MMKFSAAVVVVALTLASGVYSRELLQALPVLPPTESAVPVEESTPSIPTPAPAPAPSALGPVSCALEYLVNAGTFNTLIELVEAASNSTAIAQLLDSPTAMVTLLAPTDTGIQTALAAAGLTAEGVLANPTLITNILNYHVLPSQIQASDLVDGYSFNTNLVTNGAAQSVAVSGSGVGATFVGAKSSGPIAGPLTMACSINIFPINGLLLPQS